MKAQISAIQIQNLSKQYGDKQVLNRVSLAIEQGECILLAGHNGAGKTTLMKLMLGLTRPDTGKLLVMGSDPAKIDSIAQRRRIGFLPETVIFPPMMSGQEVLSFYACLNRSKNSQCTELLERVGLLAAADQLVQTYSKGMRQRLGLAQALLGDPDLLLLDEPTTGLDPTLRHTFYDIIEDMQSLGRTSVICTHALNAFESRVDKVAIMNQGELVAFGSLENLSRLINLPVKMHVRVTPGQAGELAQGLERKAKIDHVNAQSIDLQCLLSDKMGIVRQLSEWGERVQDVDIEQPKLDDIYHYYMQTSRAGVLQ